MDTRLDTWSLIHAFVMLACTADMFIERSLFLTAAAGALSFSTLIFLARGEWTPSGSFGRANAVTAVRLGICLFLALVGQYLAPWLVALVGGIILAADGLDGCLARRDNQASVFGARFDMEADAFFMLVMSMLAIMLNRLGIWVIAAGLLRYVYVAATLVAPVASPSEAGSTRAKTIFVFSAVSLLSAFLPFPAIGRPLALAGTLALTVSFAIDFAGVLRSRRRGYLIKIKGRYRI
jgi:phosphatidylglycerophosphate synthase